MSREEATSDIFVSFSTCSGVLFSRGCRKVGQFCDVLFCVGSGHVLYRASLPILFSISTKNTIEGAQLHRETNQQVKKKRHEKSKGDMY